MNLGSLGAVAYERFDEARAEGVATPVLREHLNAALRSYQQALDLTAADDHQSRAIIENQLGLIYGSGGDARQALRHVQQSLQHEEARGNIYGAGQARQNIALILSGQGQTGDALHYARAALDNYNQVGPGASDVADDVRGLIADLERATADPGEGLY
jgi:tetratricopeptide (TPR) repeat protein